MAGKPEDQIKFSDTLSKPAAENEQRYNKVLKFDNNKIVFDENAKEADKEAYMINDRNVLGFREEKENSMFGGRNKTVIGDATAESDFSYNGGVEDSAPKYYNNGDDGYKDSDFEARTNATYIVEGMNVNQLRNIK